MAKLLGISASLRHARWGKGNRQLISELHSITDYSSLISFLKNQSDLLLEDYMNAGRREGKPFLEIYSSLKKHRGHRGLCNSEIALAAALWAAHLKNIDIDYLSLAEYFPQHGHYCNETKLRKALIASDAILLSGPVYFGDRGSLTEDFINYIRRDHELRHALKNKLYGGISIGAKRNGGQETTLIYQLIDMVTLGFLAVGNDSDTTAQYGGTCHAGDVGSMWKDEYGLKTAMGTGRRLANLLHKFSHPRKLEGPLKVLFLVLQDTNGFAKAQLKGFLDKLPQGTLAASVIDITEKNISRCLACDICPKEIGPDEEYRCIISSVHDDMASIHQALIDHDAIVPVAVSLTDFTHIVSNYQVFLERTRYLRRSDYVFSDAVVAPLVFQEPGSLDLLPLRMTTSMIRHHTILSKPMIGHIYRDKIINNEELLTDLLDFLKKVRIVAQANLGALFVRSEVIAYKPIGYILSAHKEKEDKLLGKREVMIKKRTKRHLKNARARLKSKKTISNG